MRRFLLTMAMLMTVVSAMAYDHELPQIRKDHPRLFFNNDTWPQVKARAEGPARAYMDRLLAECDKMTDDPKCENTEPVLDTAFFTVLPVMKEFGVEAAKCALAWRLSGEEKYLVKAKKMLFESVRGYVEATRNMRPVAWTSMSRILEICAYDWLYNDLTDAERRDFIVPMAEHVRRIQPYGGPTISGQHVSKPGKDGFYGVNSLLWYSGLAAYGDGYCDELAEQQLHEGLDLCLQLLANRNDGAGDDGGLGTGALNYTLGDYPWAHFNFMHTYMSATGVNLAAEYPRMSLFPNWVWWMWIRDDSQPDVIRTAGQGDVFHGHNTRNYPYMYEHMTQYVNFYRDMDPVSCRLALALREHAPSRQIGSVFPVYPFILDEDVDLEPFSDGQMEHSPLKARHFEKVGQILMRSDWTDDATYCTFTAGTDGLYNHKHKDENNFIIYKYDHLAIDSGCRAKQKDFNLRHYCAQSVAHNVILINKPGEPLPWHWGPESPDPEDHFNDGGMYESRSAEVLAFETNQDFTYVASDATDCYGPKSTEAVRQFIHVQPDYFIVYDRVGAEDKSYPKRWLLHTVQEPEVRGRVMRADCGRGRIYSETLLPAGARLTKIGGPGKEFWSNGKNWPFEESYAKRFEKEAAEIGRGPYFGAWRLEVSPRKAAVDDRFLHVLTVGDTTLAQAVDAVLVKDRERDGVTLTIGGRSMTFWFNRTGEVGGAVSIDGKERALTRQVQPQSGVVLDSYDIPDLEPKPDFWKVRPMEVMELCANVKKGRAEVIAHTPLGYPVYALFYGPFTEAAPQTNWSAGNSSTSRQFYIGDKPDMQTVMVMAGIHGAEPESVASLANLIQMLESGRDFRGRTDQELLDLISRYRLIIVPCVNMDGRSICPDHLRLQPFEVFRAASQGVWADGSLVGWRGSKEWFPLPLDRVSFPGGYPNSEGYNIQHDATPGDMRTEEAAALVRLAARWRVDYVLNCHSHEYPNLLYPPSHIDTPEHIARAQELQKEVHLALQQAGLRGDIPYSSEPSRTVNINSLFNLASGALAQTFEVTVSQDDIQHYTRDHSFEELMEPVLVALKTILRSGCDKPLTDR